MDNLYCFICGAELDCTIEDIMQQVTPEELEGRELTCLCENCYPRVAEWYQRNKGKGQMNVKCGCAWRNLDEPC